MSTFSLLILCHFRFRCHLHQPSPLPSAIEPDPTLQIFTMAEAMCGPSNALQQFKQTTSLDRSLQQDRFGSRRHQAQGFRSANANAGMLDPEFEAFQQGRSVTPVLDHAPVFPAASRFAAPSQLPSWADDFQRMAISPASHMQQSQPQPQAQLFPASAGASSWAQGFREQMNAPRASSPSPLAFQQMARYGATGYSSSFTPQPAFTPEMQSAKGKEPMIDAFDEAAFERAFDMAREDMMADEEVETQGLTAESVLNAVDTTTAQPQLDQDMPVFKAEDIFADIKDLPQVEQVPVMQQEQPIEETVMEQPAHDDDALAATAQELLHKVEHNQSDKFKNSQFLGLMRKLADRQVRVEGDKMVETVSPTATSPAIEFEPAPSYAHTPPPTDAASYFPEFASRSDADLVGHEYDHWESPYE